MGYPGPGDWQRVGTRVSARCDATRRFMSSGVIFFGLGTDVHPAAAEAEWHAHRRAEVPRGRDEQAPM